MFVAFCFLPIFFYYLRLDNFQISSFSADTAGLTQPPVKLYLTHTVNLPKVKQEYVLCCHKYVFSASKPLLAIWHYMFLLVANKILVPISVISVIRMSLFVLHHNYLSMCSLGRNLCSSGRNMDSYVQYPPKKTRIFRKLFGFLNSSQ